MRARSVTRFTRAVWRSQGNAGGMVKESGYDNPRGTAILRGSCTEGKIPGEDCLEESGNGIREESRASEARVFGTGVLTSGMSFV